MTAAARCRGPWTDCWQQAKRCQLLQLRPKCRRHYPRQTAGNKLRVVSHDSSCQIIEGMLGLAVQHEEVVEGLGGKGRGLQQVTQLTEAICCVAVHVEECCVVQRHLCDGSGAVRL